MTVLCRSVGSPTLFGGRVAMVSEHMLRAGALAAPRGDAVRQSVEQPSTVGSEPGKLVKVPGVPKTDLAPFVGPSIMRGRPSLDFLVPLSLLEK